jgi:XRE family transcriptional regulator, master regulator for biofilm formation
MIGKRIQRLRLEKGLSLSDVAERAGVAKSYLSSIERDIQTNPSIAFLEKVSAVLGISLQSLIQEGEAETLDDEWLEIVRDAQRSGVSKEQFLEFLEYTKWKLQKKPE